MYPIIFRTANVILYSYSICMALALLGGIGWVLWKAPRHGLHQGTVWEGALLSISAAVLGARLFEGVERWDYFQQYPLEILRHWQGNLSFQGGLLAGSVALLLYCYWRGLSFWEVAGLAVPGLALATALGWLGALLHGANYGFPTFGSFAVELPDLYGIVVPRFPTQVVGIFWSLLVFALLLALSKRKVQPRTLALTWLFMYAGGMFALEFTRADETLYFGIFRIAQLLYLAEGVGAGAVFLFARRPVSADV
ncbi:MAG: prolipoprotein diacylglyceryl transferase [Chloroflexi bacterium]|nr:prolipoprotein diacylglyceryl transferase [Chloroflexota bacterium]